EFRRSDHARLFYIEHLTQRVFDRLPEAVVVLDADGKVGIATEIARNIFGLKVNTNLRDLKLPLASNIFQRAVASGFKTVPEGKETVIQQFLNGEEKFFQPEATPIFNEERQFTGAVLLLKDVTDSLQQNEMKKGLVSTVSHQLKTPLTSIRMAIHVLLEEKVGPLSEKQVELLLAAQEDSDRLYNILSNLLDISRIESGGAGMSFRKEDANELALDAVDSFAFAAHDKGVSIRAELPGDLPEVWADATQISHVFSNILSNALRYTDPGGEIIISAAVDEHKITFNITDTGKGIPPEHLDTIFEQFFRVPDQDAQSGSGLGLAIVKQIVEAHGGKVSASSVEGKGSTFAFTLSRADRIKKEEITQ
ncbi:MAG TPA: ATP-binding protein, partial [Syntrophorhabdaceae bacterium]|nr:ATP-binding protein [Syntrophorhabdaceae bacterium]